MVLYMAVTPDKFETPVYMTETLGELSMLTGYSKSAICHAIRRYADGLQPTCAYHGYYFRKVEIQEE